MIIWLEMEQHYTAHEVGEWFKEVCDAFIVEDTETSFYLEVKNLVGDVKSMSALIEHVNTSEEIPAQAYKFGDAKKFNSEIYWGKF